jgi:hypothetical protein
MKTLWSIAVLISMGCLPCSAQNVAEDTSSVDKCRALAQSVMARVAAGDDRGALELIRPQIQVDEKQFNESRDRTLAERRNIAIRFGRVVGTKVLREERVSDFLYRVTYVEKREIHLLRWQFTFYRAKSEWQLNSYTWDDNVAALFDRAQPK